MMANSMMSTLHKVNSTAYNPNLIVTSKLLVN